MTICVIGLGYVGLPLSLAFSKIGKVIGYDSYYLAHKAKQLNYTPNVILSGRKVNNKMGKHIAHTINNIIINNNKKAKDCNALILGVTFKENCSDLRNSKVFKLYKSLIRLGIKVDIFDPHAINEDVFKVYNLKLINQIKKKYDVIILAVAHDIFLKMNLIKFKKSKGIIYDVKSVLDRKIITKRL